MNMQNGQQLVQAAIHAAYPQTPQLPPQVLFTVEQFSLAQPAFTAAALRNLIFKADARQSSKGEIKGNGLLECGAVIRIGRKVLIDGDQFMNWVRQQNGG